MISLHKIHPGHVIHYRSQRGAVLIISMLLLLVMTLIGVTGMRNTTLEEKMAGNSRDLQLAFNAAEAALRQSEALLQVANLPAFVLYDGTNTGGYYRPDSTIWTQIDWTDPNMTLGCANIGDHGAPLFAQPVCYIEEMPAVSSEANLEAGTALTLSMYRITARAVGGSDTAEVVLRATFRR